MTDATFKITGERQGFFPGSRVISIGRTELLNQADLLDAKVDLSDEGYAIAAKGETLFLLGGRKRGAINAVYALLEEDLGCRWYDRKDATIPKMRKHTFKPVLRSYKPVLMVRDPFYWTAFDPTWSLRNRTNAPSAQVPEEYGGRIDYALWCHTYNVLVPPDKYFKDHPEYFSEHGGKRDQAQLCLTNPDVLKLVIKNVRETLKKNPNSEIVDVSPNDWEGYCECANCKAIDDAEGSKSGTLIKFVNAVAEDIEKDYPNVKVNTLAYLGTFMPPKTIKPHKNVLIRLCTDSHAWGYTFSLVTETERFQKAIRSWAAIGANVTIWDYTVNFSHHPAPMPNMPVVDYAIPFYIRHNAKGIMLQGFYECGGTENAAMRSWVWAKKLWDPTLSSRDLMRDFIYGYYKEAAEPVWKYNDMLWNLWEENHAKPGSQNQLYGLGARYVPNSAFLGKEFQEKADPLLAEAAKLAKDPDTVYRVRVANLPLVYIKLCQGIGYLDDAGNWIAGDPVKVGGKEECKKLLDEWESLGKSEGITVIREAFADYATKTKTWRDKLEQM
jgi:hypothetical protein